MHRGANLAVDHKAIKNLVVVGRNQRHYYHLVKRGIT
jgi:hypothetical protein